MITDADLARWEALCAAVERGEVRLRPTRREDGGSLAALTAALPALLAEVRRLRDILRAQCEQDMECSADCPSRRFADPCYLAAADSVAAHARSLG